MRVNLTIVNRSPNMSMLTAATIATFLLTGSSAQESGQKCYACGPESAHWYPNVDPPSCDNFTEINEFSVDCGDDYNYCGITTTSKSNIISRVCSKNLTEYCAVENEGSELNIICTCNSTLCNGVALGDELSKSYSMTGENSDKQETQTVDPETKFKNISDNIPEDVVESTTHIEMMMKDDANIHQTPLVLTEDQKPNETNIHIMTQVSGYETVTSHSLPSPAALGQDGKSSSQQGAPVDDEEDTLEGSGSNPTTTTTVPTTETPTTTTNPGNGANCLHKNILIPIIWTIGITYAFN